MISPNRNNSPCRSIHSLNLDFETGSDIFVTPQSSYFPQSELCGEVENQNLLNENQSDPLGLKHRKITQQELKQFRKQNKKLNKFYLLQNKLIDEILDPNNRTSSEEIAKENFKTKIAVYGSAIANVLLMILQLAAALLSSSLSIYATLTDAFMDVLSSGVLIMTNYLGNKSEIYRYPSGKGRYETVGILLFGTVMCSTSMELIINAGKSLVEGPTAPDLGIVTIILICIAFGTKLCLFLYCRLLKNNPSAKVLAQDHRNDLFVNATGLGLAILGSKVNPYIDPIGAIIVALIIFRSWIKTVREHSRLIVGKAANPEFLTKIIYIALTHDPQILEVDTCRAYHSGPKLIVEVDIVLNGDIPLRVAHDLGESLQMKLESLTEVERAYVHVDYETSHKPEHGTLC